MLQAWSQPRLALVSPPFGHAFLIAAAGGAFWVGCTIGGGAVGFGHELLIGSGASGAH